MIDFMDNKIYMNIINQNVGYIKSIMKSKNISKSYDTLIILGSGLDNVADSVKVDFEINYIDMPYIPVSKVVGHKSKFVFGTLENKNVVVMVGRIHYYEGYNMREVTLPIRVMKKLGVTNLIVTNASGAINNSFNISSIVLITDHINFNSINPLIGENLEEFGDRFPAMAKAYDKDIIDKVYVEANSKKIDINKGIYLYVTGPNYETMSEIKMFRNMGADIVAMSTVPEVIVARHSNMRIIGLSCVTDICENEKLASHQEVLKNSKLGSNNMLEVIKMVLNEF